MNRNPGSEAIGGGLGGASSENFVSRDAEGSRGALDAPWEKPVFQVVGRCNGNETTKARSPHIAAPTNKV